MISYSITTYNIVCFSMKYYDTIEEGGGGWPPLPLAGEASPVQLEKDGGPLTLHRKCGPLQSEEEGPIAVGEREGPIVIGLDRCPLPMIALCQ